MPECAAAAVQAALVDAGLRPQDIDYINAHGTGTVANDATEALALKAVFTDGLPQIPVSSTKPVHGHALGAAGAIECAVTLMALREEIVPPTLNFRIPDPKCDLDCVPHTARKSSIRRALSNSFAFGGINAVLALGEAAPL